MPLCREHKTERKTQRGKTKVERKDEQRGEDRGRNYKLDRVERKTQVREEGRTEKGGEGFVSGSWP